MKYLMLVARFLARVAVVLIGATVTAVMIVVFALCMGWWQLVGLVAAPFGSAWRKKIGFALGCWPFMYAMLGLFCVAALTHWGVTGRGDPRETYYSLCALAHDRLEDEEQLHEIGSPW